MQNENYSCSTYLYVSVILVTFFKYVNFVHFYNIHASRFLASYETKAAKFFTIFFFV